MIAEVLGSKLGLELYRVDLLAVVSKYIGDTETNLAQVLAEAEAGNVMLYSTKPMCYSASGRRSGTPMTRTPTSRPATSSHDSSNTKAS